MRWKPLLTMVVPGAAAVFAGVALSRWGGRRFRYGVGRVFGTR